MKKRFIFLFMLIPAFISAEQLNVSVMDSDLDFPLEGVRISLQSDETVTVITNEDGNGILELPDSISSGTLKARLPGYEEVSVDFSADDKTVSITMHMADVIEGAELVVNRSAPEAAVEKAGVSSVLTKEEMQTTANVGIVEDCMSSIRTLPGVSFSGAWGTEPSVRGGEPRELGCLLDGMYTIFPWHWGGGVSIFNPSIIDSITLSNGVFSSRYGRASSGLLDAKTLKPDYENFHVNASLSTTCADAFFQIPFGKDVGGMIFGAHLTYLDPIFWAMDAIGSDQLDMIKRPPYIRDFFLKTNLTPVPELDISVIGFFGSDGLEIDQSVEEEGIDTRVILNYDIYQALGGINVKYLASDTLLFHGLLSYNGMFEDLNLDSSENGTIKYNDDFVSKYGSIYPGVQAGGSYTLSDIDQHYTEKINSHMISGKAETEIQLSETSQLCFGFEETFTTSSSTEDMRGWNDIETDGGTLFKNVSFYAETENNCLLDSSAFITWSYGNENSLIQSEAGIRAEYVNMWNSKTDFSLRFIPDICPRASVTVTPWRNTENFDRISFTAGSGLFVSVPRETMIVSKDMGVKDFDVHPSRALLSVLGAEAATSNGWKFKLETYYKYYLSRIYSYEKVDSSSGWQDIEMIAKSNGKGHVFGIESMIEKKSGDLWDGYLSYSFVYSKLKNPAGIAGGEYAQANNGSPLDEWYFPSYHRFHTLNLVSNWHFAEGWTFTVKGTLATGTPKEELGEVTCYASEMEDGTVIQRYTRSSFYSNTLRTQISCPVDLRISYSWLSKNEKTSWEFYFALQDVFVNLYSPKGDKSFNRYTGKMSDAEESADFNIGIPIPSVGLKVKF